MEKNENVLASSITRKSKHGLSKEHCFEGQRADYTKAMLRGHALA